MLVQPRKEGHVPANDLLTLDEVATELRVSVWTVRQWRRNGVLKAVKLPTGTIRVRRSDMEALLTPA